MSEKFTEKGLTCSAAITFGEIVARHADQRGYRRSRKKKETGIFYMS